MKAKFILKQHSEANIWAQQGWDLGVEKAPQRGTNSRRFRCAGHVARMVEYSCFKILRDIPTETRALRIQC